jgi:transcriptional regulator with XRE-family HTH domain
MNILRENINLEMAKRGWSYYKLAEASDVPPPTLYRFLKGTHKSLTDDVVKKIAAGFGISEGVLRGFVKPYPASNLNIDEITDVEKAEYLRAVLPEDIVDLIIPMGKLTDDQIQELRKKIISDARKNDQVVEKYIKNHVKKGS